MTKPIPQIKKFMTTTPITIDKDIAITEAATIMNKNQIRHLPVMNQGKIEGILSSTDVALETGLCNVDLDKLKVKDCFTPNPFNVGPNATLDQVLLEMAENKYGCVLVKDNEHLVGIFTWVDALRATNELLETRLRK